MSMERDRSPVDRRGRRHSDDRSKANDCKLFVSNFPYEVRKQELTELFEDKIGNVADVELFHDENGRPRGCGLVEFNSPEAAKDALRRMDRFDWRGRKMTCKRASEKDRDEFGRLIGGKGRGTNAHECRVYVSNLPYEMKWQDVKDLFRDHVGESSYVELFSDEKGKPRGCGILEFNSSDMAQKAIRKLNKTDIKGRKILVQEALDQERDKYGYIIKGGSRGRSDRRDRTPERRRSRERDRTPPSTMGSGTKGMGYTYGLSVDFLASLGIEGPLQTKVFIANLAFSVDDEKLREVFRLAGRIVRAEVNKDRDGKSRGYGIVEYTHPVEAVQAISMFKDQKLYERPMHVRFDRDPTPEETRLPNRLPEGLEGIGMGLGSGGKPLTDVLKSLQQISETTTVEKPDPGLSSSAKTLAELTPALALLAQQMNLAATVAQTPNINALGSAAGVFNQLNPGANMLNTGFNNQMSAPQPQVATGYGTNLASGQVFGSQGFGNIGGNNLSAQNMGVGQAGMNNIVQTMAGVNGAQSQLGSANNSSFGMRNQPGATLDRNRAQPSIVPRNPSMERRQQSSSARYSPIPVSSDFSGEAQNRGVWDTIIVRNLPTDLDWQELRDFFGSCGDVKNTMIKDRGVGLVRFSSEQSVESALAYDRTMKWGRLLDVRIF